jgi:hypothetical protein
MANQTGRNVLVAYKVETTLGVAVTGASANQFRANPSAGLKLERPEINPGEIRSDGQTPMPRLGTKTVRGGYVGDLSVGTFDTLFEAGFRSTIVAAAVVTSISAGTLTTITTDATSIVAAAGSWLTAGVRVGDVFRLTGQPTSTSNNSKNLRVTAVTTLTLSVAETLVTNAVACTVFVITVAKKITQSTSPVNRSFTFEEYGADLDLSEQDVGVRVSSIKVSAQPDAMATVEFGLVGLDQNGLATGTSPNFSSPTLTTTIGLTAVDATIRVNGSDVAVLTGLDFTLDMSGNTQPVIGSTTSPDVFLNNAVGRGTFSGIRQDLSALSLFTAETEFEIHLLLVEPESEPKDFISFFIPRCKLLGVDKSFGNDGALIESKPFAFAAKGVATGYEASMLKMSTSAA